jgi:hypothetical protein
VDIFLALALSVLVFVFVSPWEGGRQATLYMLAIVWGYAIANIGALISESRLWRIMWSVPAVLVNLGALWIARCLLLEFLIDLDPIPVVVCLALLVLVLLNALVMFLRPLPPRKGG